MAYLDTSTGAYPLDWPAIRAATPNTSWPEGVSPALLAEHGYALVAPTTAPTPAGTTITEGAPILVDGVWRQTWIETLMSPEESAQDRATRWSALRATRDRLLADLDWRVLRHQREVRLGLTPSEDGAALDTYMQALADLPDVFGAPDGDPAAVVWPTLA